MTTERKKSRYFMYSVSCEEARRVINVTVAQSAVVASSPGVQGTVGCDGCAVGAAASNVHHMLSNLLPGKR